MKLPGASRKKDPGREALIALRLQTLRFRKMLETVGALFTLLEDGREKMGGDYILDHHYVESLVDEVIEKTGCLVFDACVLVEDGGEALYKQYDSHRSRARGMLLSGKGHEAPLPQGMEPGGGDLEPEYRLLAGILEWIDGQKAVSGENLMGFTRRVLDHVATGMKEPLLDGLKAETLQCERAGVRHSIRLVNTAIEQPAPGKRNGRGTETGYRHIRLMFEGTAKGEPAGSESDKTGERTWFAVVNEGHLSLRRSGASPPLRLEACLGGIPDTGMLFVYASHGTGLEARLPPGFRIEREEASLMAWLEDTEGESIEDGLVRLGRILFS
jgi:hypothetical protein